MALWITILFCSSGCFCRGREKGRKPPTLTCSSPSVITLNGSGIGVCCCSTCSIRKAKQKEQQRKPSKDQGNRGKRTNGKRDDKQHKSWWNNSLEASTRGSLEWHQLRPCSLYAVTVRFRDDKGPSPRTAGSWVQAPQLWAALRAAARHALGLRAAPAADKLSLIPFGVLVKYDRWVGLLRAESSPFGLRFRGKASQLGLRSRVTCQAFCVWGSSQGYPFKRGRGKHSGYRLGVCVNSFSPGLRFSVSSLG